MKALITGASSGLGREIAKELDKRGYELILVGRDKVKLEAVKNDSRKATVIICDLANKEEAYRLYLKTKSQNIDVLVNNAGFGLFGYFNETELETEIKMLNVNVIAVHILTKLFLKDFVKRDSGYILNVASAAGFMAGPYLSTYYASKNYVLKLTTAVYEELKRQKSKVHISALCPGPTETNFNAVAGGEFKTKGASAEYVATYAVNKMFKKKLIIIPTLKMKFSLFFQRFIPTKLLLKIIYNIQKNKTS